MMFGSFPPFFRLRNPDRPTIGCCCGRAAAHLHKVEPLSTFVTLRHSHLIAHLTGRSSSPAYIENEWQLVAVVSQVAFGVSAQKHCTLPAFQQLLLTMPCLLTR